MVDSPCWGRNVLLIEAIYHVSFAQKLTNWLLLDVVMNLYSVRLHCVCALSRLLLVVVRSRPCSETCQRPYNTPTDTPQTHKQLKCTNNIAIGGTLGWSKQQQYCQYSPDAERRMQGQVRPSSSVYLSVVSWLCTSVDSPLRMLWRTWSLLP